MYGEKAEESADLCFDSSVHRLDDIADDFLDIAV